MCSTTTSSPCGFINGSNGKPSRQSRSIVNGG
jgi:hypothetical protein